MIRNKSGISLLSNVKQEELQNNVEQCQFDLELSDGENNVELAEQHYDDPGNLMEKLCDGLGKFLFRLFLVLYLFFPF